MTCAGKTPAEINRDMEAEAVALLRELIREALRTAERSRQVRLRVPIRGDRLGEPIGGIERCR